MVSAFGHSLLQTSLDGQASGGQEAFCPLHPLTRVPLDRVWPVALDLRMEHPSAHDGVRAIGIRPLQRFENHKNANAVIAAINNRFTPNVAERHDR